MTRSSSDVLGLRACLARCGTYIACCECGALAQWFVMDSLLDFVAVQTADGTPFQTLFDISPDCMFHVRVDDDGRFIYDAANQTALSSAGLTLDQLIGQMPEVLLGPEKGGMMTKALQIVCETGRPYRYEPTWDLPLGRVTYDAIYIPEKNIVGEIVGVLGIARNITKQRELEASLHQSQKLEALGQLSSGVAHDFNNVLANMQACLILLKRHSKAEGAEQLIDEGLRTIERGKSLTNRMLNFARQQPVVLKAVDLNRLIDNIGNMLARTLGSNIFINKQPDINLWQTLGDVNGSCRPEYCDQRTRCDAQGRDTHNLHAQRNNFQGHNYRPPRGRLCGPFLHRYR